MRHLIIAAALLLPLAAQAQPKPADPFPVGDAHDKVAVACVQCHTAAPILALRMGEAGWRRQTEIMILRGAQIGPGAIDGVTSYLTTAFGPGVPFPGQPAREVHLAEGGAAALVEGNCSLCHGLDRITAAARPGQQWSAIVHRMAELGAPMDAEQAKQIVGYLEAHYATK
jgi:mono/diheme cytochrome c family protein